ncbi:hypothetical protein CGJ21_03925 [Vibrio parahaemolyticus]|nr:hypothetical protein CGJ23_02035 [Vibrio parahaemolyticus]TOF50261.1 hypothetical protein CGJ21_03925 [Vibrio parahaemolyticus]
MGSMKEFLDVLNKAKDVRLNLAIFLVVTGLLWLERTQQVQFEILSKTLLQSLFFLTVIRLVYALISLAFDCLERWRTTQKAKEEQAQKEKHEQIERQRNREKLRLAFNELDVHQLHIIQELKRQNHVSVRKGAPLFTLKNAKIIYTPAVGDRYESAALTTLAKSILEEELWSNFEQLKRDALVRFFTGMQPKDVEHFLDFLKKESICTKRYNRSNGSQYYDNERVFSAFSKTIVFTQPQRNYTYSLDPIAKEVVFSLFGEESVEDCG